MGPQVLGLRDPTIARKVEWYNARKRPGKRSGRAPEGRGDAVKVCMFHLMPYRDLAPDFDQRYKSAYLDPVWFDVADPDKVGQYYNSTLDEMVYAARHARPLHEPASPERLRLHGQSEPDGLGIGEADERAQRSDRPDRLDAPLDQPADAGRRGICADRLHQRRASGGGLSDE